MNGEAHLVDSGMVCAIGLGAAQCSASFRAGLSGYRESPVIGRLGEPLRMAVVPEQYVPPLHPTLDARTLSDGERRMLRLAELALRQLAPPVQTAPPLFLALPIAPPGESRGERFLDALSVQTGWPFAAGLSKTFALGRAGGLFALAQAMGALAAGHDEALVGGVDTCLDLRWLATRDAERRLLASDVKDGFIPGEGAAFLRLSRAQTRGPTHPIVVRAVGTAEDPGHRYSSEPALGVGLADALAKMRASNSQLGPVGTCFAGLNGEHFGAKAWGVAHMRHHDLFAPELCFEHPADVFGDTGAAMAPLLLALAAETLLHEQRPGPTLVWAASDEAPCAAAYLALSERVHSG